MRSRRCTHRICLDRVWRLLGDERGAAFAEYTPLLAVIALLVIFALAFLGPAVADTFSDPFGGPPKGDCPSGGYTLVHAGPLKKNDIDVDVSGNQDGWYCTKSDMGDGNGNGNTGNNQNVKDNNVGPVDNA